jgi:hypothetical protein
VSREQRHPRVSRGEHRHPRVSRGEQRPPPFVCRKPRLARSRLKTINDRHNTKHPNPDPPTGVHTREGGQIALE